MSNAAARAPAAGLPRGAGQSKGAGAGERAGERAGEERSDGAGSAFNAVLGSFGASASVLAAGALMRTLDAGAARSAARSAEGAGRGRAPAGDTEQAFSGPDRGGDGGPAGSRGPVTRGTEHPGAASFGRASGSGSQSGGSGGTASSAPAASAPHGASAPGAAPGGAATESGSAIGSGTGGSSGAKATVPVASPTATAGASPGPAGGSVGVPPGAGRAVGAVAGAGGGGGAGTSGGAGGSGSGAGVLSPALRLTDRARFAGPTGPHGGRSATPEPDAALEAQLRQSFTAALRSKDGVATFRLNPAHLGALTVRIEVHDGRVSAVLRVESEEARGLLEAHRSSLRDALEARGLVPDRVLVESATSGEARFGPEAHAHDSGQGRPGGSREDRAPGGAGMTAEGGDPQTKGGGAAEAELLAARIAAGMGIDALV